jgi:cobalamin biosynthesis Mg chelatase CobN
MKKEYVYAVLALLCFAMLISVSMYFASAEDTTTTTVEESTTTTSIEDSTTTTTTEDSTTTTTTEEPTTTTTSTTTSTTTTTLEPVACNCETPQPSNSGGGGGYTLPKCGLWSACIDGNTTQRCDFESGAYSTERRPCGNLTISTPPKNNTLSLGDPNNVTRPDNWITADQFNNISTTVTEASTTTTTLPVALTNTSTTTEAKDKGIGLMYWVIIGFAVFFVILALVIWLWNKA